MKSVMKQGLLKPLSFATVFIFLTFVCGKVLAVSCGLTALGVAFGQYDPTKTTDTFANGSVTVECDDNLRWGVTVGLSPSGNPRYMKSDSTSDKLAYNLYYKYPKGNIYRIWGDSYHSRAWFPSIKKNKESTKIIYGLLFREQYIASGSYQQIITATVYFSP